MRRGSLICVVQLLGSSSMAGGGGPENRTFLDNKLKSSIVEKGGCCHSKHTRNCCFLSCVLGSLLLLLGIVVLAAGKGILMNVVLSTMPLKPGTDRLASWLNPPVQPHLTGYAFNVTNPVEVEAGGKPILQEVGPFVYKAVTVKDSRDNLVFNDDGETLTYRPRKFYFIDLEQSIGDPDKTFITVPNIPLITGLSFIKDYGSWKKATVADIMIGAGRGTAFVNVSFSGLLWGYEDALPCEKIERPSHCPAPTSGVTFNDDEEDDDDGFWDDKRRKRSAEESLNREKKSLPNMDLREGDFESWEKPKAGYVNCSCIWGLFRDRNVTLRKPVTIYHGNSDLKLKGRVKEYNRSPVMNWWVPGSKCDQLGGQDGGTLAPGLEKDESLDLFIDLMCRRIVLEYEGDQHYPEDLTAHRYVPPPNAMGSHLDEDPLRRNEENSCYCVDGFACLKSGVLNMGPCKRTPDRPLGAPLALSYPHFYEADPHYLSAVEGLRPEKERHQFYVDVSPEFGFPLAIRPRFQLNLIIERDQDIPLLSKFPERLVLPFLWAQDGFDQPSVPMAQAIKKGLDIPAKFSRLIGVVLLALGGGLLLSSLVWILWKKRSDALHHAVPPM